MFNTIKELNIDKILLFTGMNLIYVLLGVGKDVFRQTAPKKWSATIACVTYSFYVIVVKAIVGVPTEVAIIGTAISNFLGDYFGRMICEWILPRGVVCYRFTINKDRADIDEINNYLETHNFGYKWEGAHSLHNEYLCYQVYTQNKEEDRSIEALMTLHNIDKYNKSESKNIINTSKKV